MGGVTVIKRGEEEIQPLPARVRIMRGAPQWYQGKKTPQVTESVKISGPIQKPLSEGQLKRVIKISEKDNGSDKASARANKVLDRMKKRNIVK
jgi:hypothetical protein